jgi:hypothetical protein
MTAVIRKRKLHRWRHSDRIAVEHDVLVVDATAPMTPAEIAEVRAAFHALASGELQRTIDDKVAEFAARGVDQRDSNRTKARASVDARKQEATSKQAHARAEYRKLIQAGREDRETAGIIARKLGISIRTVQTWKRAGNWSAAEKAN